MPSIYKHRIKIGFTDEQKKTLDKLKQYGYNTNEFVRAAVREKIDRERPDIKSRIERVDNNYPKWMYD